jgi:hypothetical protein
MDQHVPAGAGMVLKVGRVSLNSDPRFYSQHYTLSDRHWPTA